MVISLIPAHEKRILEAHVRKVPLRDLALTEAPLDEYQSRELKELIRLRMQGLPLQYLTGSQDFYGREFYVNTAVLVPRPETEGLVELTLKTLRNERPAGILRGLDLGTGSGCIAATLCLEISNLGMVATDCSEEALDVASENLRRLNVRSVALKRVQNPPSLHDYADLLSLANLDFIVSNPPYLARTDEIAADVRTHEPEDALYAPADDVLSFYRHLFELALRALAPSGFIAVELAHERAAEVQALALQLGLSKATLHDDLTQRSRYCVAFR